MKTEINGVTFQAEKYGYLYANDGDGNGFVQIFDPRPGDGSAAAITVLDERDFMKKCRRVAKRWSSDHE